MTKAKCAYCGRRTGVHPGRAMSGSGPLRRFSHSPVRLKFPPMCHLSVQGRRAQVRVASEEVA
jgi:hypothetical protein